MFIKVISIISLLTLLSRVLGYLRDLLIAKVIGAGLISDCFFIAFKLPNLFRRLFAEGSMNSAFIPVVSGVREKMGKIEADQFFSKIFSILLIFLFFFVILLEIFAPLVISLIAPGFSEDALKKELTVDFARLTFPFLLFICATSLIGAYLNTLGKFASMALTPVILNLTIITCLVIFFKNTDQTFITYYLSLSISIAGIIQLVWMLYNLKRNKVSLNVFGLNKNKFRKPTNKFLKLLVPAILGNGVYQLNLLIDMILASTLAHGSISFLYYADRVNQLPLGVLGIAISTALLPILSKYVKKKDNVNITKSISSALKYGLLFSLPAFFGIFILSDEIVTLLFYRGQFDLFDVAQTSAALVALSFGLPAFIMIKILVIPFFAREDTITPIKVSLFSISINLILNLLLIDEFKHVGLAISTSVAAWVNMIILISLLIREKIKFEKDIIIFSIKIIISTMIMGISIQLTSNIFEQNLINIRFFEINNVRLIFVIFFAILIYFASIYLLGIKDISLKKWSKK